MGCERCGGCVWVGHAVDFGSRVVVGVERMDIDEMERYMNVYIRLIIRLYLCPHLMSRSVRFPSAIPVLPTFQDALVPSNRGSLIPLSMLC
jgi:hypothetical protein